jgi:hypothetical protein
MNNFRLWAAVAGFVWGMLAFAISFGVFGESVFGGLIVSPLIGLIVATAYLPAYRFRKWVQALASLGTLYTAVALFGLAIGVYDALRPIPNRSTVEVILQMGLIAVLGITFMGYPLVLWPLAFLTHQLLRRTLPKQIH